MALSTCTITIFLARVFQAMTLATRRIHGSTMAECDARNRARQNGHIADLVIAYHSDITKSWIRITFRGS